MDLSHSGWSDIFFLGMDYPEGARVLNISVDLGVHGRDPEPKPPIQAWIRVIPEPVIRLACLDLGAETVCTRFSDVFDFARDYTGLLKAALVASGLVPQGMEGSGGELAEILGPLVGPGRGVEVVSLVNDIPKGSRLAVSTNLLASLITVCMRATGQVDNLEGPLRETEARIVVGRAVLGEWLGGSGGGWQDSGGIFPGIKVIQGERAEPGDPEFGQSNGRLLPRHRVLGPDVVPEAARKALQDSLVVVHGGMAANVGPILEMVTEKHLLGDRRSWEARQELLGAFDPLVAALGRGDLRAVGQMTTRLFQGPLQTIIPWVSNLFTQTLIAETAARFGDDCWGFWMLGGMSGGGMGLIFHPDRKDEAKAWLATRMPEIKARLRSALPFAMDPVVYDFAINDRGTWAELAPVGTGVPTPRYALQHLRGWVTQGDEVAPHHRHELAQFTQRWSSDPGIVPEILSRLLPGAGAASDDAGLDAVLARGGFDPVAHEIIRSALRAGTIGLAQNRLPPATTVEDVRDGDVVDASLVDQGYRKAGERILAEGRLMILTLAGGAGTRWTQGAGTVKALHPFAVLGGAYRNFLEIHRAKARKAARTWGMAPLHVVTASELTLPAVDPLVRVWNEAEPGLPIWSSPGRSLGLRMVPMVRDLRFLWEESGQQRLEERKQKVLDGGRRALREWAQAAGEGSDYRDNLSSQCVHPVGHWYELANLVLNGTLARALEVRPGLEWILLHNLDTLGAVLDPGLLGHAEATGRAFSWEVITRRIEDHGGGLARIDGRLRLVEGLALPREEDEARLSYYNSATCWIRVEALLDLLGLTRADLGTPALVLEGVRRLASRMPTY
ncbi:MAG TPA: UTP--glucose-1-phosphate uridylyltransferase, partial [Spirochaetia bacterium]|nr:UTP--glucose-1-phosphate uridylyltransferase [Spirochaetia bacterium]